MTATHSIYAVWFSQQMLANFRKEYLYEIESEKMIHSSIWDGY